MRDIDVNVHVGHKSGEFFLPLLKDAKQRLWIMSPWIASEFMELILSKKAAGVDVRIMTSNDFVAEQKKALAKLLESRTRVIRPENKTLKYWGIALIVAGLFLTWFIDAYSLLVTVFGLVLVIYGGEKSETYWISKLGEGNLKVFDTGPYNMVHAKIYVADDTAIVGSANFTGNGMRRSLESMVALHNPDLATHFCEKMNAVPKELNLTELSYNKIAWELQKEEPIHRYYSRRRYRW